MVVVEEAVPVFGRLFAQRGDGRAVDEINIQVTVVIVIEERHAGQHGFGQVLVGCGATVGDEVDAGTVRDFFECDGAQGGGGRGQQGHEERECSPSH